MNLRPIEKDDLQKIVDERLKIPETLRTGIMLNYDMQLDYYNKVLCDRDSKTRYFAIEEECWESGGSIKSAFIGYGGLENISLENRSAEISLLIFQEFQGARIW